MIYYGGKYVPLLHSPKKRLLIILLSLFEVTYSLFCIHCTRSNNFLFFNTKRQENSRYRKQCSKPFLANSFLHYLISDRSSRVLNLSVLYGQVLKSSGRAKGSTYNLFGICVTPLFKALYRSLNAEFGQIKLVNY